MTANPAVPTSHAALPRRSPLRRLSSAIAVACSVGTAIGCVALLALWLVRPSQFVVELTRFAFAPLAIAAGALGLLASAAPRGRLRRVHVLALSAAALAGLALALGPGRIDAQSDVVIVNDGDRPLSDLQVVAAEHRHTRTSLAPGERWRFVLEPDIHGSFRFAARDADGAVVSARTVMIEGEPDRYRLRIAADGAVSLQSEPMRTRLTR